MTTEKQSKSFEVIDQAQKYLDENIRELIDIYGGRWVIIYDNRVVDSDKDEWELVKRAEGRGRFDLKYATPMFRIPESVVEYQANKRMQERQLSEGGAMIDGFEGLEEIASK